jgi:hypothetical protein
MRKKNGSEWRMANSEWDRRHGARDNRTTGQRTTGLGNGEAVKRGHGETVKRRNFTPLRFTHYASRITHHASRLHAFTFPSLMPYFWRILVTSGRSKVRSDEVGQALANHSRHPFLAAVRVHQTHPRRAVPARTNFRRIWRGTNRSNFAALLCKRCEFFQDRLLIRNCCYELSREAELLWTKMATSMSHLERARVIGAL